MSSHRGSGEVTAENGPARLPQPLRERPHRAQPAAERLSEQERHGQESRQQEHGGGMQRGNPAGQQKHFEVHQARDRHPALDARRPRNCIHGIRALQIDGRKTRTGRRWQHSTAKKRSERPAAAGACSPKRRGAPGASLFLFSEPLSPPSIVLERPVSPRLLGSRCDCSHNGGSSRPAPAESA